MRLSKIKVTEKEKNEEKREFSEKQTKKNP